VSKSKLTPKQKAFVRAYLETGNATEAYRRAYDASKMTSAAIEVEAKRLLKHPLITLRLGEVNQKSEIKALLSLEEHMEKLAHLRDRAEEKGQMSAAIAAEVKRGELRRFYVKQGEKPDHTSFIEDMSDAELAEFIRQNAGDVLQALDERNAPARKMRH
jgi:phage terminase small subunit